MRFPYNVSHGYFAQCSNEISCLILTIVAASTGRANHFVNNFRVTFITVTKYIGLV